MWKAVTGLNKPNETGNFLPIQNEWIIEQHPIKVSTAIEEWTAVWIEITSNNVTGYLTKQGTDNAAGADFVWILAEPITATDDDYATAGKLKAVWVPMSINSKAEFTVWAGTFTLTDVYRSVQIHSDSISLAVDTTGLGASIVEYKSSTRWVCKFDWPKTQTA